MKAVFKVSPGFVLLLGLLFFAGDELFGAFCIAALIHESAHLLTMFALGGRIAECRLTVFGAVITADRLSYAREIAAVSAGPAASLIAAYIASCMGYDMLAGLNLVTGIYNILPARCLDGGRVLELGLSSLGAFRAAYVTLNITTIISAALVAAPLILAASVGVYNWSLLVSAGLILLSAAPNFKLSVSNQ
ncbi:hypothetical protein FACS1894217_09650 [Clostridia bacterium]|nr:hypothetical protein FACS1894217_09650 [Clostridia bacterium]